jgi:hypothetical protein
VKCLLLKFSGATVLTGETNLVVSHGESLNHRREIHRDVMINAVSALSQLRGCLKYQDIGLSRAVRVRKNGREHDIECSDGTSFRSLDGKLSLWLISGVAVSQRASCSQADHRFFSRVFC